MKSFVKRLLVLQIVLMGIAASAQIEKPLYVVSPYEDSLWTVDTATWSTNFPGIVLADTMGGTISGSNGLAVHPCTGEFYILYKNDLLTGRPIGKLNTKNGIITRIGDTGDKFAAIAFGNDTTLYGVTGDGGSASETLFQIDINTGAATLLTALGNGSDGENIGFCSDNGNIYHWSGRNTDNFYESVDTNTFVVTSLTILGFDFDEIFGSTYLGNGEFLLANLDQEWMIADTNGFVTNPIGVTDGYYKGLGFPMRWVALAGVDTFCSSDSTLLLATAGSNYQWVRNGTPITNATDSFFYATLGGNYTCIITVNSCADTADISFDLVTISSPVVAINPLSTAYYCTSDSILLTGSITDTCQWYKNGVIIPGADTNIYYASTPGIYNMTQTNQNGCTDSSAVGTYVMEAPPLAINPSDTIWFCPGDSVLVTATAAASSYVWYKDFALINGADSNSIYVIDTGFYQLNVMFSNCADSIMFWVLDSCPLGIFEAHNSFGMLIYPNPVTDDATIIINGLKIGAEVTLLLSDVNGRIIRAQPFTTLSAIHKERVDIKGIRKGFYIVTLQSSEWSSQGKIVIQ